jgi:hypothetical protein
MSHPAAHRRERSFQVDVLRREVSQAKTERVDPACRAGSQSAGRCRRIPIRPSVRIALAATEPDNEDNASRYLSQPGETFLDFAILKADAMFELCIKIASVGICLALIYLLATRIAAVRRRRSDGDVGIDTSNRYWYQFSSKTILITLALLCVVVVGTGLYLFRIRREGDRDANEQMWVAAVVIDHMERNGGSWPREWQDLEESHEIVAASNGRPWNFDELRGRVAIDFKVKPAELAEASADGDEPPFRVIYLRNGKTHYWRTGEPNRMILDYLTKRAQRPESYVYPKHPHPDEKEARAALLAAFTKWELDENGRVTRVSMSPFEDARAVAKHLKSLKELRELNFQDTNITDDDLEYIRGLTNLESVSLAGTRVTDAGLKHLKGLKSLQGLGLSSTKITDAGLEHLKELTSLTELGLTETKVTDEGIKKFQRALPKCEVSRYR